MKTPKKETEEENLIDKVVKLTLISSLIKNEKPLSLILVAPPEQSKSYFLLKYTTKKTHIASDLSYFGLINVLKSEKKIKQIIIPDFLKVTEKGRSTQKSTITAINGFIEEGLFEINLANREKIDLKGKRGGILTATTTYSFYQNSKKWAGIGFQSRFLLLRYSYTDETLRKILKKIARADSNKKRKPINLPYKISNIEDNIELNEKIIDFCSSSGRRLNNYITLLKSIALKNHHPKPTNKDFSELEELFPLLEGDKEVKI